jgi:hypothetical protein
MFPDTCWYENFFLFRYVELVSKFCPHLSVTPCIYKNTTSWDVTKRRWTTRLHGAIFQKTMLFVATTVRTWTPVRNIVLHNGTRRKKHRSIQYVKTGLFPFLNSEYAMGKGIKVISETWGHNYLKFYCAVRRKLDDTTWHVAKRTGMNSIQPEYILVTFFHINKVE